MPPTSAWCARVTAKPSAVRETSVTSGRCVPPVNGSLRIQTSPGAGSCAAHGGDRVGHRAEVHRDVLGLRDHAAALVEERRRAVAPLLDVRRERRADEHRAHLLRDRAERAADHLELDVHSPSARSVPCAVRLAAAHPCGDPAGRAVELDAARGPATSRRRPGVEPQRRARAGPRRCAPRRARSRAARVGVAVALLVRAVEALRELRPERHRQLERLAAVAEVGLALRAAARPPPRAGTTYEPHAVAPLVARDEAERREHARRRRDEHASRCRARPRARTRAAARRRRTRRARSRAGRGRARPRRRAARAASPR